MIMLITLEQDQETTLTLNTHMPSLTLVVGQGQPRVIVRTTYGGLESPMIYTKFRGNRSYGSREDV